MYFDEPIVKANASNIRFPKICPVCGERTTKATRLTLAPRRKRYLRASWDPMYFPSARRRLGLSLPDLKTFVIPVCENHYYQDEAECRYKFLCVVSDGLCGAGFIFAIMAIGSALWVQHSIPSWALSMSGVFVLFIALTLYAFRPNQFQVGFKIIGFDAGLENVLFQFKNIEYREAFLQENPMHSELVNWIVRTG